MIPDFIAFGSHVVVNGFLIFYFFKLMWKTLKGTKNFSKTEPLGKVLHFVWGTLINILSMTGIIVILRLGGFWTYHN